MSPAPRARRLASSLASVAMLAMGLTLAVAPCRASPREAVIDLEGTRPYGFCPATLSAPRGLAGSVRLYGLSADGQRSLLFRSELGYERSLSVAFYAWPGLARLELEATDGDGQPVGASARVTFQPSGSESTLSALPFPFRETPRGSPPARLDELDALFASAPNLGPGHAPVPELATGAARLAQSRLFATRRNLPALAIVSAWTALALGGAWFLGRRAASRPKPALSSPAVNPATAFAMAAVVLATLAASGLALAAARPRASLYELRLPEGAAEGPRLRLTNEGAYDRLAWSAEGAEGRLAFLAVLSPLRDAVPIEAFDGLSAVRFASPPTITLGGVEDPFVLAADPYLAAWGLYD